MCALGAGVIAWALGATGCAIDSRGRAHWTIPASDVVDDDSRVVYWNGHHGEPTVHRARTWFRPDTGQVRITYPK